MDWITSLKEAIIYMEEHLLEFKSTDEIAREIFLSPFYFQQGFQIVTGFAPQEYMRNRRLYLAAIDLTHTDKNVAMIANKYGYDNLSSFTKAFSKFHGSSPSKIRNNPDLIHIFLPLKIMIKIEGGFDMDYCIKEEKEMTFIGFEEWFDYSSSYKKIPEFWSDFVKKHCQKKEGIALNSGEQKVFDALVKNRVGEFAICDSRDGLPQKFRYLIAGIYNGYEVPSGMKLIKIPALTWAKFHAVGPLPESLQAVNSQIFKEWLPSNPEYEMSEYVTIEQYSDQLPTDSSNYESWIWVPIRNKNK